MRNNLLKSFLKLLTISLCAIPLLSSYKSNTENIKQNDERNTRQAEEPIETNDSQFEEIAIEPSFGGRSAYMIKGINDRDVTVETFFMNYDEKYVNNSNIGQAVMLNNAIRYKQAHPDEKVEVSITSFRFSVAFSVCLDSKSENYLKTKALYDCDYDDEGYVRLAYLPILAASNKINTIVLAHLDASKVKIDASNKKADLPYGKYFYDYSKQTINGVKISDYLTLGSFKWTSYNNRPATDMMHLKSCSVSNYRDENGVDHGSAIWLGSSNIDGIDYLGCNGYNATQSATIVTEHEEMRNALFNYTKLLSKYKGQEDMSEFRYMVNSLNKKQIDLIKNGQADLISKDEQIVYLGTDKDPIFELYFTPLAGSVNEWNLDYNPYSKFITKLLPCNNGDNYITFSWPTVKLNDDSNFSNILFDILHEAFINAPSVNNKLVLSVEELATIFDDLIEGENIGLKKFGLSQKVHTKDFQLSYVENGERMYVSVMNSLNFHQGSSYYQANSFLVIKESAKTKNNIFVDIGKNMSEGAITENDRVL